MLHTVDHHGLCRGAQLVHVHVHVHAHVYVVHMHMHMHMHAHVHVVGMQRTYGGHAVHMQ